MKGRTKIFLMLLPILVLAASVSFAGESPPGNDSKKTFNVPEVLVYTNPDVQVIELSNLTQLNAIESDISIEHSALVPVLPLAIVVEFSEFRDLVSAYIDLKVLKTDNHNNRLEYAKAAYGLAY